MILILGVTASGKGRLAFDLAEHFGAEILSIDSMKVYRRMDIGTAKPPKEARQRVKYHLIDVVEPSDSFSVGAFIDSASDAMEQINSRNRKIIAVGGTALYIKSLFYGLFDGAGTDEQIRTELRARAEAEGLAELHRELTKIDPDAAERINPNDAKRIVRALEVYQLTGKPISSFQKQWQQRQIKHDWTIIGLRREKTDASSRINTRVKKMIGAGLVDEVKSLLDEEKPLSKQARCAIGYAEIIEHLSGQTSLEDATELIKVHTRRLAKGQRTWFKTFTNVHWLDIAEDETPEQILARTKILLGDIIA
ncbi:MAG TPA: tRNA (adenosine(37)-N6)-dimethylallyltransferase MiaA [Sedimentisphaerales bacterium]|nr:tRNA (adenosine(37)-N6)-dimethylallyltransferase MiaA [Sedimentisphaerales bacterium]